MKRMLFNAVHQEELRVAIVDGQKLLDLDIESAIQYQKKGNIYKGVVTRVEQSLEAAFVDYGSERQGFLPLKEISRAYFNNYSASTPMAMVRIQDVIKEGQELIVQVEKDERGNKGAALTTFISLAGRFLVLMPNNPKGGGISRRIEGEERADLRDAMSNLTVPNEHALIARTAGIGKTQEDLQWDLDYLLQLWNAIDTAAKDRPAPFLVYQETNLVVRAIRDYLRSDINEIIIDDQEIFERASKFMQQVMPHNLVKLKQYEDTVPLFSRFQIEHQIESAYSRDVRLGSGGALVIDHTEAVVTIDVNSARATKGADIEETALHTNLEAVDEIARQLRIRDIGGLIVIDLIDMTSTRNQRTVENRLVDALKVDRARVQVGRISRFGLLEMSRQRIRSALGESNYSVCPRCEGNGHIRNVPSSALSILRILQEEALKENTEAINTHLPLETATYLLNEKRHELSLIEKRLGTRIFVIPTEELETPHFRISRMRSEEMSSTSDLASFQIQMEDNEDATSSSDQLQRLEEVAVVGHEDIPAPAPPPLPKEPGFFSRIFRALIGPSEEKKPAPAKPQTNTRQKTRGRPQRGRQPNRSYDSKRGSQRQGPARRSSDVQTRKGAEGRAGGSDRKKDTRDRSRDRDGDRNRKREPSAADKKTTSSSQQSDQTRDRSRQENKPTRGRTRRPRGARGGRSEASKNNYRQTDANRKQLESNAQPVNGNIREEYLDNVKDRDTSTQPNSIPPASPEDNVSNIETPKQTSTTKLQQIETKPKVKPVVEETKQDQDDSRPPENRGPIDPVIDQDSNSQSDAEQVQPNLKTTGIEKANVSNQKAAKVGTPTDNLPTTTFGDAAKAPDSVEPDSISKRPSNNDDELANKSDYKSPV